MGYEHFSEILRWLSINETLLCAGPAKAWSKLHLWGTKAVKGFCYNEETISSEKVNKTVADLSNKCYELKELDQRSQYLVMNKE